MLVAALLSAPGLAASAADERIVTFAAVGDISSSAAAGNVLTAIGQAGTELTTVLGDLSYGTTGQEQAWCDFVTARVGPDHPFELLAGNHESNGQNGRIESFAACLPNRLPGLVGTYGKQFYIDYPQVDPLVRFVMISPNLPFSDGTWNYPAGSTRYNWTATAIDGARSAGIPWVVAGMHKPCLSMSVYSCEIGADLLNLLVSKRVDLVLNGHEHAYQRTKQLALSSSCTRIVPGTYSSSCVRDGGSELVKGNGSVTVTVGTGGIGLRSVTATDPERNYFATFSGSNVSPTHGFLKVSVTASQLSASFVGVNGSFSDSFTITSGGQPVNQNPTASFTHSCSGLTCTFDGRGSTDTDGSISAYRWDFGDGTSATGSTANRTYTAGGRYPVTLTVTDNQSGTGSTTRTIDVSTGQGPTYVVRDDFARTVSSGFGTAPVGGAWTRSGSSAAAVSVSGGSGLVRLNKGNNLQMRLDGAAASGVDLRATVWTDQAVTGSGLYYSVIGRRVPGAGEYQGNIKIDANRSVSVSVARAILGGATTTLGSKVTVPGLSVATGEKLNVRMSVSGSSTTTINIKVWKATAAEPAGWTVSRTDNTAALQTAGSTGINFYLSSSATTTPVTVHLDDWIGVTP